MIVEKPELLIEFIDLKLVELFDIKIISHDYILDFYRFKSSDFGIVYNYKTKFTCFIKFYGEGDKLIKLPLNEKILFEELIKNIDNEVAYFLLTNIETISKWTVNIY